jgi:hypothetical protein
MRRGRRSAAKNLLAFSRPSFSFDFNGGVLRLKLNSKDRWVLDPSRFDGRPGLTVQPERTQVAFLLKNALFPGTQLPADLDGKFWRDLDGWRILFHFRLGELTFETDLCDWLSAQSPAEGEVRLDGLNVDLTRGRPLRLRGKGIGRFTPDWRLCLNGDAIADLSGFGSGLVSDSLELSLTEDQSGSLFAEKPVRATRVSLNGAGKDWNIALEIAQSGEWSVAAGPGTFDSAQIELTNREGSPQSAVLFRGSDARRFSFDVGPRLRKLDGSPQSFALRHPHYAIQMDGERIDTALLAHFEDARVWAKSGELVMQLSTGAQTAPFELVTASGQLENLTATPALTQVLPPVAGGDVWTGPVAIPDSPPLELRYVQPDFLHRLKCWIGLCDAGEFCVPMHGARIPILRTRDLLRLDFEFVNLAFTYNESVPYLVRTDAHGNPIRSDSDFDPATLPLAYVIVHFPPQNIYEEALEDFNRTPPPFAADQTVRVRISGPSRLVFHVYGYRIRFTLDSLLEFDRPMSVVSTAVLAGERPVDSASKPVKPGPLETSVELPYRLYLSPNRWAGWANRRALPEFKLGEWIELWHTRLGILKVTGGVDERETARRTLRAVWAEDYTPDPCLKERTRQNEDVPFNSILLPPQRSPPRCSDIAVARPETTGFKKKKAAASPRGYRRGPWSPHIPNNLDLLWAPSIYFVQTGYSIYTLRQASRRSWRIGQRSNVVVRFLTYNETMQTSCLRLMGKKLLVSLAMEGKFSNEGLQGIEDDDDVLTAMARELVTQRGVGESASAVWKAVQEQHARLLPASSVPNEEK